MTQDTAGEGGAPSGTVPEPDAVAAVDDGVRDSALFAGLFDGLVAAAECRTPGDPAWLLPMERAALGTVSSKRLHEFAAGRACARHALRRLGVAPRELPAQADRRPRWPSGFAGSISHTDGLCAAVVAPERLLRSLGIDLEVIADVSPVVWPELLTAEELRQLARQPLAQRQRLAALTFSAKEAFYKCQYALTRQWLEFHDVVVEIETAAMAAGGFRVVPRNGAAAAAPGLVWQGRYCYAGRWVATAVTAPAGALP
ncbi:4'-phosphopantetheinyl transferase family protein [Solimonas flava]|uniref:4'-phosphopantetheinyl transferase family protein n=1 Tax=Solimonas flava TaxID=415849 RepID=UPI000414DE35|nr:4'-phosphopantetheinyl transferase superfamily protein [Solimonas flava]